MLLASLALTAALLQAGAPPPSAVDDAGPAAWWDDVELPRGFALELASGVVSNRAPGEAGALRYEGGLLRSVMPLRRLDRRPEGGPRQALERGAGEPAGELAPVAGLELGFDLGARGWGYARVLEAAPERLRLEVAFDPGRDSARLERRPRELTARSGVAGVDLAWEASEGAAHLVERRPLAAGAPWEPLAEVAGGAHLDDAPGGAQVFEYRVSLAGLGPRFGARARGAAGLLSEEQSIELFRGQSLDLVTGEDDPARAHLTVEYVGNKGAQLGCGPGVTLRVLAPAESAGFELPGPEDGGYRDQRMFVTPDREVAVLLPGGLYARVRLEAGEAGEVYLSRQLDLAGGRVFPPAPGAPRVSWEPERGVILAPPEAAAAPAEGDAGPLTFAVEREDGYRSGAWSELGRIELGGEPLLDPAGEGGGLARYRLRYVLAGVRRSLPGPVATVLVGDDGGPGTAALLAGALADLGHPEFERRRRAEGVLGALGPRAAEEVRALLEAEDPEVVAAARRILSRSAGPTSEAGTPPRPVSEAELAAVILGARARAQGLGDPPRGWLADEPWRRAGAMLRLLGAGRDDELRPWRELLASADPDPGVRLVAAALGSWRGSRRGRGPAFQPLPGGHGEPFDLSGLVLGFLGEEAARRDLAARLDPSRPWTAYVQLQILHELDRASRAPLGENGLGGEREVLERAALAASLLQRDRGEPRTEAFLEAALEVVGDPRARLSAAANLADLRFARRAGPAGGPDDQPREVIVLPAADGELLMHELDALRDAGPRAVDLVLPAGEYALADGRQSLLVAGQDLRLLGEGEPVLRFGLSFLREADVVLEGLRIEPETGSAISLDRAAVLLRRCTVVAPALAVQASNGVLELDESELLPLAGSGQLAGGVRLGMLSLLLARESSLVALGGCVFGARTAYLERCVVDGGERSGIEGRMDGEVLLFDCYVRGDADALANVHAGVLEGAILAGGEEAARNLGPAVRVCPLHSLHTGPPGALQDARRAEACLVGR